MSEINKQLKRMMFSTSTHRPKWFLIKALQSLPEDAVIIDCTSDFQSHSWGLIIRSKDFAPVEEGAQLPTIHVQADGVKKEITTQKSIMDAMKDL